MTLKHGFDSRIVSYEYIHNIKPKDTKALTNAIDPRRGEKILDAMCGYGAAGKKALSHEEKIDLYLLDESPVQMKRAKKNLHTLPKNRFIQCTFLKAPLPENFFDKVIIKMGLHELPKDKQILALKKCYKLLKPSGKLVIWDLALNETNQKIFQRVIRKKDKLAGYNILAKNRYFFTEKELNKAARQAGFSRLNECYAFSYQFSSLKRLESEFHNDLKLLDKLNQFIRAFFPAALKHRSRYMDNGKDIRFEVTKKIFILKKG